MPTVEKSASDQHVPKKYQMYVDDPSRLKFRVVYSKIFFIQIQNENFARITTVPGIKLARTNVWKKYVTQISNGFCCRIFFCTKFGRSSGH